MINQKSKLKILIFLLLLSTFYFLLSDSVFAVDYLPLVPCGLNQPPKGGDRNWNYTRNCTTCDSFRLAKNVIDFVLFGLVPPIAVLLFIIGGFLILFGGPRPEWYSWGTKIFWSTFIGLIIVFSSWLIINTIIKTLGPEQVKSAWYKFTCKEAARPGLGGITLPEICLTPQELAKQNNVPYPKDYPKTPGVNAPELNTLISCIKSKLPGEDLGSEFTFEKDENRLCNFTRGKETCGQCAHKVNSCHYGGSSGNTGSLAVDFGNERIGDKIIEAALECGAKSARCEEPGGQIKDCSKAGPEYHVHINASSCDRN